MVSNPNGVNLHAKKAQDEYTKARFKPQRGKFTPPTGMKVVLPNCVSNPNGVNLHRADAFVGALPAFGFKPQRGKFTQRAY